MTSPPANPFRAAAIAATTAVATQNATVDSAVPAGWGVLVWCATNVAVANMTASGVADNATGPGPANLYPLIANYTGGTPRATAFHCAELTRPLAAGDLITSTWMDATNAGKHTYAVALPNGALDGAHDATVSAVNSAQAQFTLPASAAGGFAVQFSTTGAAQGVPTAWSPAGATILGAVTAGPTTTAAWWPVGAAGPFTATADYASAAGWRGKLFLFQPAGAPEPEEILAMRVKFPDGDWRRAVIPVG